MKIDQILIEELYKLIAMYGCGETDLAHLSYQSEILIEKMQPYILNDIFLKAMNCIYLIEEVNALALDEGRPTTDIEMTDINAQLSVLKGLFDIN